MISQMDKLKKILNKSESSSKQNYYLVGFNTKYLNIVLGLIDSLSLNPEATLLNPLQSSLDKDSAFVVFKHENVATMLIRSLKELQTSNKDKAHPYLEIISPDHISYGKLIHSLSNSHDLSTAKGIKELNVPDNYFLKVTDKL